MLLISASMIQFMSPHEFALWPSVLSDRCKPTPPRSDRAMSSMVGQSAAAVWTKFSATTPSQSSLDRATKMDGSTSSSITSTSHTLTFAAGMAPAFRGVDPLALLDCLDPANRHAFVGALPAIPAASLQLVKATLDGFAGTVSDEQQQSIRERNRKRKRSERAPLNSAEVLKLRRIHVDGFETGQVWQQARRVIANTLRHSSDAIRELEEANSVAVNGEREPVESDAEEPVGEEGVEEPSDDSSDGGVEGLSVDASLANGPGEDAWTDDEDEDGDEDVDEDEDVEEPEATYHEDAHGLNDGFFSIDDFNKQTLRLEEQDATGDPYTDQASDDEDVDWNADPFAKSTRRPQPRGGRENGADGETHDEDEMDLEMEALEDDVDDDDGPTFGDMDLFAPEGASDDEGAEDADDVEDELNANDVEDELNANDILYKDFFAPPAKRSKGPKEPRKVRFEPPEDDQNLELAMASAKRDLFDVISEDDGSLSDASAGDPRSRRSAHERRQAKIAEEIRKLEAAAVAKKEWTMSGEIMAAQRPQHSVLEQDLDFEFIGKPVPVITNELTEDIDAMIKRRILADEFDDVVRRYPDDAADTRRGLVEVDGKKSKKGLAELYEEDHLKAQNPDTYISKSDEKLQKEEHEVVRMSNDLVARLDALCNLHYKPASTAPTLTVVADVATITMEDAQPATAQGVSGGRSMLAPQELYTAGKETAAAGEVVSRSGLPVARQEMTREDKKRRRRREKERQHKAGGQKEAATGRKAKQQNTMADLKKGGVKVINRKGEVVDVDGKKAKVPAPLTGRSVKL
jgi:U3 small nucleolar RNA-associated protein MPP10